MKTITPKLAVATATAAFFVLFACNKNGSSGSNPNIPQGKSQVNVYMMDDPIEFSKVLIDVRQIAVLVDTATTQSADDNDDQWNDNYCGWHRGEENKSVIWDTLSITPGVYDLLQLRNGADTLMSSGLIPTGKILKVKITLGSDNSVYTDSTTSYPLEVFGPHPYFVVNVRRVDVSAVSSNQFKLWLDFNLERSIFFWSGTYYLSPYITVFNDEAKSKVQGQVLPSGAGALVTLYNSTDTLYAIPNWDGGYQFRGVTAGSYSLNFKGRKGYSDTTISNISVDSSKVVRVQTVTLHK